MRKTALLGAELTLPRKKFEIECTRSKKIKFYLQILNLSIFLTLQLNLFLVSILLVF
jgi:hypothetical protein